MVAAGVISGRGLKPHEMEMTLAFTPVAAGVISGRGLKHPSPDTTVHGCRVAAGVISGRGLKLFLSRGLVLRMWRGGRSDLRPWVETTSRLSCWYSRPVAAGVISGRGLKLGIVLGGTGRIGV